MDSYSPAAIDLTPEGAVSLARKVGADGISFTYNEPTIWLEYVRDCAEQAKEVGLLTNLVTNGYMTSSALDSISECMDAIRIDVKGNQEVYDAITSEVHAHVIRRNTERVKKMGIHLEVVTNLIPGLSDKEEIIRDTARWIAHDLNPETPWHLTRFHPARNLGHLPPTSIETLERSHQLAKEAQLRFVYLGNVPGHPAESTWCPDCGELLLRRSGWGIREVRLKNDRCPTCNGHIPLTGRAIPTEGGPAGPRPVR
jgi:pyruvate formate lyase activating enzyme